MTPRVTGSGSRRDDVPPPILAGPYPGEWFCLPQVAERVDVHAPDGKQHRWIVAGSGALSVEVPAVLRTTQPAYEGRQQDAHGGRCESVMCRIDQPGWVQPGETRAVLRREFSADRRSCLEPDEDVIDLAMSAAADMYRRRIRRGR